MEIMLATKKLVIRVSLNSVLAGCITGLAALVPLSASAAESEAHLSAAVQASESNGEAPFSGDGEIHPEGFVWNLDGWFASPSAWETTYAGLQYMITNMEDISDRPIETSSDLVQVLDLASDLRRTATSLALYGLLTQQTDTESPIARSQEERGRLAEARVETALAFLPEMIESIAPDTLAQWREDDRRLDVHSMRLNRLLYEQERTQPAVVEAVLRQAQRWPQIASDGYWALINDSVDWPLQQDGQGQEAQFDYWAFQQQRRSGQLSQNTELVRAFFDALAQHREIFALLLTRRIEADLSLARARGFERGSDALFFFRDGVPEGTAQAMISAAQRNEATLTRFLRHRRSRTAGEFTYFDTFQSAETVEHDFSLGTALHLAQSAIRQLGPRYLDAFSRTLDSELMHLASAPDKEPEYAIYPPVGNEGPNFIFSYQPTHRHSRALTGALVLMTRWNDLEADRIPDTRDDPPIFANGLIFAGDLLHDDALAEATLDNEERRLVLEQALDFLWEFGVRYIIASEFELEIERMVAAERYPTGSELDDLYGSILAKHFRPDITGVEIPEYAHQEWMMHSVSFASFEQLNWPPAMAVAALLVERARMGDDEVLSLFLPNEGNPLTDRSYHQFLEAGIDLTNDEIYDAMFRRMDEILDQIEAIGEQ